MFHYSPRDAVQISCFSYIDFGKNTKIPKHGLQAGYLSYLGEGTILANMSYEYGPFNYVGIHSNPCILFLRLNSLKANERPLSCNFEKLLIAYLYGYFQAAKLLVLKKTFPIIALLANADSFVV